MLICKSFHFAVSLLGFIVIWVLFFVPGGCLHGVKNFDVVVGAVYAVSLFLLFRTYNVYNIRYARVTDCIFGQVISNILSLCIVYVIASFWFGRPVNPLPFLCLAAVQGIWDLLWSFVMKRIYNAIHKRKKTLVIYRNENDLQRVEEIRYLNGRFSIEKLIENPDDDYKALEPELEGYEAIIVSGVNASLRNGIAKYCIEKEVLGYFAPHVGDIIMQGAEHLSSFSVPIMRVRRAFESPVYLAVKRLFDILMSFTAIVVLSPVYLITALAIKLCDRGPVLYKQVRLTKDGKEFKILKFRSMKVDAEKDGVARLASENDDRITPVGKFIRACRLDELPQFINILKGDMSFVGPRPERPEIAAQYEEEMPAFSLRLQVKAGLTGFAQVYGKYNTNPYDKLQMDLMYINKMSVLEDLWLMLATLRVLFMSESTEGIDSGSLTAMNNADAQKNE